MASSETEGVDISVIIVNYNVAYFLDQCLASVSRALSNLNGEVIVVDNASVDASLAIVREKYPQFTLIANTDNAGFSKANNQAIRMAKGSYVLLLNPDTVVGEDTFEKILRFMDEHPDAGGLGVQMIDGSGNFLPESKRGLPTPWVAFYKIFGLSALFPKSKRFNQYHAGHVSVDKTAEVDILSGAFMLIRKSVLDQIGLLDETFFMYGEDIDLSYRIQHAGYRNYYFADTDIIHYKGESTKKSSVNYVFVFYKAMIIFAKKHFMKNYASSFSVLIHLAIYLRAGIALIIRFLKGILLPAIDLTYILLGLFALTAYWKNVHIEFPYALLQVSLPVYTLIWMTSIFINGGYDKPIKPGKYIRGALMGTLLILVLYALLPKDYQFSRLFIFLGTLWVTLYYLLSRIFLHFAIGKKFNLRKEQGKTYLIVGSEKEFERIQVILEQSQGINSKNLRIEPSKAFNKIAQPNKNQELIFSSADVPFSTIIRLMKQLRKSDLEFKIAPENADYLIGSNSIDTAGDLYILNVNTLSDDENKRKKRLFDFMIALTLLLSSPFLLSRYTNKKQFIKNLLWVVAGRISFIGFTEEAVNKDVRLPKIKTGILSPCDALDFQNEQLCDKMNLLYARDYSWRKDFLILLKSMRNLDRKID